MIKPHIRQKNIPVVSRKVTTDLEVTTIFGTKGINCKYCPGCHTVRSASSFYLRSPDYTKLASHITVIKDPTERLCVSCRDEQKKRRLSKNKCVPTNTIERFFDE